MLNDNSVSFTQSGKVGKGEKNKSFTLCSFSFLTLRLCVNFFSTLPKPCRKLNDYRIIPSQELSSGRTNCSPDEPIVLPTNRLSSRRTDCHPDEGGISTGCYRMLYNSYWSKLATYFYLILKLAI